MTSLQLPNGQGTLPACPSPGPCHRFPDFLRENSTDHLWYHPPPEFLLALLAIPPQRVWAVLHKNAGSQGQGLYFPESGTVQLNSVHTYRLYKDELCLPLATAPPSSLIQALITKTSLQPTHSRTCPSASKPTLSKTSDLSASSTTHPKKQTVPHILESTTSLQEQRSVLHRLNSGWGWGDTTYNAPPNIVSC